MWKTVNFKHKQHAIKHPFKSDIYIFNMYGLVAFNKKNCDKLYGIVLFNVLQHRNCEKVYIIVWDCLEKMKRKLYDEV